MGITWLKDAQKQKAWEPIVIWLDWTLNLNDVWSGIIFQTDN